MTAARKRKRKPLPLRERLRRLQRELVASWPLWVALAIYVAVLFAVAIDPLVDPHMPERGRHRILGAIPLSYRLLAGDAWDWMLFALIWLPWLWLAVWLPGWRRRQRAWERQAARRQIRERERRRQKRAEREAARGASDATGDMAVEQRPRSD